MSSRSLPLVITPPFSIDRAIARHERGGLAITDETVILDSRWHLRPPLCFRIGDISRRTASVIACMCCGSLGGTGATAERIQEIMERQVERPVAAQIYTYPQPRDHLQVLLHAPRPAMLSRASRAFNYHLAAVYRRACRLYSYASVTHVRLRSARPILLLDSMSSSDELTISGHKRSKSARASAMTPCSRSRATRFFDRGALTVRKAPCGRSASSMETPCSARQSSAGLPQGFVSPQRLCNRLILMVGATGIEPVTPSMSTRCSPAELRAPSALAATRVEGV